MSDPNIKPPVRKPNAAANKHQRRPSFHTRRRSQHSIASFGDIAEDVIKAPSLGKLGEEETVQETHNYEAGSVTKSNKKKHDRKSSNIHEFFQGGSEQDMDNIVQSLMEDEALEDIDLDANGQYSPQAIDLEDAPVSDRPLSPPKYNKPPPARSSYNSSKPAKARGQSFGGIVDLFDKHELEHGKEDPNEEISRLREENRELRSRLEKSNRKIQDLEQENSYLRKAQGQSEIEHYKASKIQLILAAVTEIDRLRSIIVAQNPNTS